MITNGFRLDRIVRCDCLICGQETEIEVGRIVTFSRTGRVVGPLIAIQECPHCGSDEIDPEPYREAYTEKLK